MAPGEPFRCPACGRVHESNPGYYGKDVVVGLDVGRSHDFSSAVVFERIPGNRTPGFTLRAATEKEIFLALNPPLPKRVGRNAFKKFINNDHRRPTLR